MTSTNPPTTVPKRSQVPSVLLPEILGFSPQLLLDDVVNVANNAVTNTVDAMEQFLQRWADGRAEKTNGAWDSTQEVEQGLVAFQTLLEYHTDVAFDFFEAWSLRNIFAFVDDLPIVVPHQAGLDLATSEEDEQELMDEIASLREEIDAHRKLNRLFSRALRVSSSKLRQSKKEFQALRFLQESDLEFLDSLPEKYLEMYEACSTLPPHEPTPSQNPNIDPSKPPWEAGKVGYRNWVSGLLVERLTGRDGERKLGSEKPDVDVLWKAAKATESFKSDAYRALGQTLGESLDG